MSERAEIKCDTDEEKFQFLLCYIVSETDTMAVTLNALFKAIKAGAKKVDVSHITPGTQLTKDEMVAVCRYASAAVGGT